VFVLAEAGRETGRPEPRVLGLDDAPARGIAPDALAAMLARGEATVIDLSTSRAYRDGHIDGAWFAIRGRLAHALARIGPRGTLVLTSENGIVAQLAVREAEALARGPVRCLDGGNRAWTAAGLQFVQGEQNMADEPLDLWLKAYERSSGVKDAMEEYLRWEIDLVHRIEQDGTCRFTTPD